MNFLHVGYFLEVCRRGSALQAARALGVSQPAVSMAVKSLEAELGVTLFERTNKGMRPTAAGAFLQERCEALWRQAADIQAQMQRFSAARQPVRLGLPVQLNQLYWADLYFRFQTELPGWEFRTVNRTVPVLLEMLRRGELDGVMFVRAGQDVRGSYIILREEQWHYAAMSAAHPLAGLRSVSYRQLMAYPVLRYAGDDLYAQILEETYRKLGGTFRWTQRFDQLSALLQFLAKSDGIAYLNKAVVRDCPGLVSLPIEEEAGQRYRTYFVWSGSGRLAGVPPRFFEVLREYFAQLEP